MNTPRETAQADSSRRSFLKQSSLGLAGAAAAAQVPLVHAGSGAAVEGHGDQDRPDRLRRARNRGDARRPRRGHEGHLSLRGLPHRGRRRGGEDRALEHQGRRPGRPVRRPARAGRGELGKLGIDIARNRCFTGFDAYQQAARDPRDQLRDPGHAAPFPADAPEGGHRGGQERVHREARGRRRPGRAHW